MAKQMLKVLNRKITGRKVKTLRKEGMTPANVFGNKLSSVNISVETKPFQKLFSSVGESSLIYLHVEGEKEDRPVFVRDVVRHPVTGQLLHVAFNQVNLKEKVSAPVPVKLIGESPAEKEKKGILVQQLDELELVALPADMPEHIEVDVSALSSEGDNIKVSDLKLDKKLEVEVEPDTIIVQIESLAAEEAVPVQQEAVAAETTEAGAEQAGEAGGEMSPGKTDTSAES